jgi:hypothetical protein
VPVDNGPSQRRGLTSDGASVLNQASAVFPKESSSESLAPLTFALLSTDFGPTKFPGVGEAQITPIGDAVQETTSSQSRSQTVASMKWDGADFGPSQRASPKESLFTPLGSSPETSAHGTSYLPSNGGPLTGIGGTVAATTTTYYKLRAKDTGAGYVEWVTTATPLTTGSYPGTPVGTLVDLTVLSIVTV